MMRRRLDLSTVYDVFVSAIFLIISMQIDVQAVRFKQINLRNTYGSFSSPNYPSPYPNDIYYEWIMPMTFHELQIEFVELDLYNCYVRRRKRDCDAYDYVYISNSDKSYCNWNKPTKPITFLPWTKGTITFYSSDSSAECKGRGFKVKYRPFDPMWHEPTTRLPTTTMDNDHHRPPTTRTTTTLASTESPKSKDVKNSGQRSEKFDSKYFLLILLALPLILVVACLYWSCRRSRRPTVNEDILQTAIDNWNYQTGTPVVANSRVHPVRNTNQDSTLLTVDLPPMPRTGYCDGITQIRQPTLSGGGSFQRQTNANDMPETVAHDPPPSYDEVWRENDDFNHLHSHSVESPPSYEAVMTESANQSRESLNQEPVEFVGYTDRYATTI